MKDDAARPCPHFALGGESLPVLSFSGEEGLSGVFRFSVEVLTPSGFSLPPCLGSPGTLTFPGPGVRREVCGIATALEQIGRHSDGRSRVEIVLESLLARLRLGSSSRVLLGLSVPEIVRNILQRHGIPSTRLRFHLTGDYPARPWTVQVQESDLEFLSRLLARAGIFYRSASEEGEEILHFADHNGAFPHREGAVSYRPHAGLPAAPFAEVMPEMASFHAGLADGAAFEQLIARNTLRPGAIRVQAVNAELPGEPLLASAGRRAGTSAAVCTCFATGARSLDDAAREARRRAEREDVEAFAIEARGDVADLFPGAALTLDSGSFGAGYAGDYIVERLSHRAAGYAGEGVAGDDLPYACRARLIGRETPYRPAIPINPELPLTFSARIESGGPVPRLDAQGRYQVRTLLDGGEAPHAEASVPIRRLSPHGGPGGELPAGWHTPLHDGAEVVLSCLNNDPDQPMIVGTLPNPATPTPVTSANPSQNILRSAGDSELLLDDLHGREVIRLRTFAGHNILEFDASALGHRIALASRQGAVQLQAKKTMHLRSGDTLTERSGNDRLQNIEKNHRTETRQGEIHHQGATDIRQQAGENIRLRAGKDLRALSGKRLRIDAAENARVAVRSGAAALTVEDGEVHIQAAGEVRIEGNGGGDITFAQSGGGFTIRPDGTILLFGQTVTLKSGSLTLNGRVSNETGAPPLPEVPEALTPLSVQGIPALQPEGSPQIFNLAWSRERTAVGSLVEACFTVRNFQGGEAAEVTIFETNGDGSRREVDRLQGTLTDGFGQMRLPWRRSEERVREDLVNDETAADPQPLTYIFEVAVAEARSQPSSGLRLTAQICLSPVDQDGHPLAEGSQIDLIDAEGRRHTSRVEKGEVLFEGVCLGPWQLHLRTDNLLFSMED